MKETKEQNHGWRRPFAVGLLSVAAAGIGLTSLLSRCSKDDENDTLTSLVKRATDKFQFLGEYDRNRSPIAPLTYTTVQDGNLESVVTFLMPPDEVDGKYEVYSRTGSQNERIGKLPVTVASHYDSSPEAGVARPPQGGSTIYGQSRYDPMVVTRTEDGNTTTSLDVIEFNLEDKTERLLYRGGRNDLAEAAVFVNDKYLLLDTHNGEYLLLDKARAEQNTLDYDDTIKIDSSSDDLPDAVEDMGKARELIAEAHAMGYLVGELERDLASKGLSDFFEYRMGVSIIDAGEPGVSEPTAIAYFRFPTKNGTELRSYVFNPNGEPPK